jgi:predicted nuclease of restriction endonuclease-like (RecB) superfamily
VSAESITPPAPTDSDYLNALGKVFPLSGSQYVRLLSVRDEYARRFYETEALRGGWSLRQLDRQIQSMFYERTALSKNKVAMLTKHAEAKPGDAMTAEEEIKNPVVLEFLGLKDEYSEAELEEALILHLESFLLELGNDFTFVARQKRIRVGDTWYRMDLLFYHRRLRCLVIIDLKPGKLDHADIGQMNLYINYAYDHLTLPDENPPVGLILCSEPDAAVAQYAMNRLHNTMLAAEYRTTLPDPAQLEAELAKTRRMLEAPQRQNSEAETPGP